MAWIESHQSLGGHPKTKKFARKLGVTVPTAIGHLHLLWYWALDYAKDGNLSWHESEDIAEAIGWTGDADQLIDALLTAGGHKPGWIERRGNELHLHDWQQYGGKFLANKASDAERKRNARNKRQTSSGRPQDSHGNGAVNGSDVQEMSEGHPADNHGMSDVDNNTVQYSTNSTVQTNINNPSDAADELPLPPQPNFEAPKPRYDRENVFGAWQRFIGNPSDGIRERLASLDMDYGEDWTKRAIEAAAVQGAPKLSYIEKVLREWRKTGHAEPWTLPRPPKSGGSGQPSSSKPKLAIVDNGPGETITDAEREAMQKLARKLDSDNKPRAPAHQGQGSDRQ
ncbi:DnaD domain-containing protein [Paenibacillus cymbidii]|uniref:DnaD domain protein n=1 Tax=Paenibacillus cymbidii TaxID=1639034 RepID=UPI0010812610|nr:DnaD domain protein [Paenibacillus cymbidii]